jgi:hypothetical protein
MQRFGGFCFARQDRGQALWYNRVTRWISASYLAKSMDIPDERL